MLSHDIGKGKKEDQGNKLFCNDMILLQNSSTSYYNGMSDSTESNEQQQFQNKKMQVYHPKDIMDMEIEELRMLMMKVS